MVLAPAAASRLRGLLYKKALAEVAPKVLPVLNVLYGGGSHGLALDAVLGHQFSFRPMAAALADVRPFAAVESNVLRFSCRLAYVGAADWRSLYPAPRERLYLVGDGPRHLDPVWREGLRFEAVKARDPQLLAFSGAYYLVFANFHHAALYYLETRRKMVNGVPLALEFVPPLAHVRKMMPFARLLAPLEALPQRTYTGHDVDPHYDVLCGLAAVAQRRRTVRVRNLPFGLSVHSVPRLLWDYDLAHRPVRHLATHPETQTHVSLVEFANEESAQRFVRNFHGRRWEPMQTRREKALFEPLLCEVLD